MFFENNNYDFDVLSLSGFDFKNKAKYYEYPENLLDSKEGFLRGNMFRSEYIPYKDMNCKKLNPTCPRQVLLYKIMELDFAINDLNLYLDLHPEDEMVYEKFKKYIEISMKLKDDYANNYGPLTLDETNKETYNWINNPWPWEKSGGSMYV
jgi:spore coat protein JB